MAYFSNLPAAYIFATQPDISAWIAIVRSWLEAIGGGQAELMQVIQGTAMSPIKVWMALLLGGFRLENRGDFYGGEVLVG